MLNTIQSFFKDGEKITGKVIFKDTVNMCVRGVMRQVTNIEMEDSSRQGRIVDIQIIGCKTTTKHLIPLA